MKPLAPNTLLQNRYLIVHLIGKGGMGEVYLAVDQRLGSAVALKRTFYAGDEQLGNAFEREARTLARLRHAVLPKVSDHFIENGNQFLVMEHISGDDLSKRLITTQKAFPLSWVLFWADQLLDALAYLHSHEPPIIHRDIKPQNLKLTDENNIVLLDFGLSKNSVTQSTGASGTTTGGSSVVGYTPHYAPMEQIRGTGTSPRSDIYSLSATLYQLLTNVVPPDALTRADQIIGGKPDPIQPISDINSEIPRAISDVILKGMSISQEQRYAGAREMQKVLREAYANMQNAMSAQTVAFNAAAPAAPPVSTTDKTEQFSVAPPSHPTPPTPDVGAQTIPYGMMDNGAGSLAEAPAAHKTEQVENFDATLRDYQMPAAATPTEFLPAEDSAPKQSAIKTEVYLQSDFAAPSSAKDEPAAASGYDAPNYDAPSHDAPVQNFAPEPNFTGDQTTPYIAYEHQGAAPAPFLDQTQAVSGFDPAPAADHFAVPETQYQPDGFTSQPRPEPPAQQFAPAVPTPGPAVKPPAEKKKSKGLLIGVLGALFALFALAAAGIGVGWYVTGGTFGLTSPTPEPTPTVAATPTPEPSPTATATPEDANANVNAGNTNADAGNTNGNNVNAGNTNAVNSATPERTPQNTLPPPQQQTRTPQQQQQQPRTPQQQQPRTPQPQQPKTPSPKTPRPTIPM